MSEGTGKIINDVDDEVFLDNLKRTIKEYLTDLTYIDVTTLIGDPKKTKWRLDYTRLYQRYQRADSRNGCDIIGKNSN